METLSDIDSDEAKFVISDIELILDVIDFISSQNNTDFEIIIPESEARQVRLNFPLNSRTVELMRQDRLSIYSTTVNPLPNILTDRAGFYNLIRFGKVTRFYRSTDDDTSARIDEELDRVKTTAGQIEPDILPWSELLSQLEKALDRKVRQEFERLIEAARIENLGALDGISVAIISAAQAGTLLNDLVTWAGDVELASNATFSRRKQVLEEQGVIRTEKVPTEVGRPKQRLLLSDEIERVGVRGEDLEISRKNGFNRGGSEDRSESDSESRSETDPNEDGPVEDELQILEQELKEAISTD
jgi:hypothetical protein